jgi:hypothetical protein
MALARYDAEDLVRFLKKNKIGTIDDFKATLGTTVDLTVWRKLNLLDYRSSYSHHGKYYTLDRLASFDEAGLWRCAAARFSRAGTLLETARQFVESSEWGYSAGELQGRLGVSVKESLLKLVRGHRLNRELVAGVYVYGSSDPALAQAQWARRREQAAESFLPMEGSGGPEIQAAVILFYSMLNEKQRRCYAGLESMKQGSGGDQRLSKLLTIDAQTVARGRRDLLEGNLNIEQIRRPGAGRKPLEKKRPRSSKRSKPS